MKVMLANATLPIKLKIGLKEVYLSIDQAKNLRDQIDAVLDFAEKVRQQNGKTERGDAYDL